MSWHGKGVLAVGPFGDWVKYVLEDESVLLAPEVRRLRARPRVLRGRCWRVCPRCD